MMSSFDIACRSCDRLASFLDEIKIDHPDYYTKPVPAFGANKAQLLIVGLAPGMHGANRTGRPFTGDQSGIMLYETLYAFDFANKPESIARNDGLKLKNCRITNAVKCLPPQNKPSGEEIKMCNHFLAAELKSMPENSVLVALGTIAHNAILRALGIKQSEYKFSHNAEHDINEQITLIDSYHCSRYNTQTKRLTEDMFHDVFAHAKVIIESK